MIIMVYVSKTLRNKANCRKQTVLRDSNKINSAPGSLLTRDYPVANQLSAGTSPYQISIRAINT